MRKIINGFFVAFIVIFLLSGLINTLFFPDDINYLENRYANKVGKFTIESYLDGSFQKQFSSALNDQVPLQGRMKKTYNYLNSFFESKMLLSVLDKTGKSYVSIKSGTLFQDHLVYCPRDYETLKEKHDNKVANISEKVKEHKDIDFYVYYIEGDTDINFETNQKIGAYEYLERKFNEIGIPFSGLRIHNYEEFSKYFYKTDHHWNCFGSYQGYCGVMRLLDPDTKVMEAENELLLDYEFSGSKAAAIGVTDVITEKFPVLQFQYPEMDIFIDGQKVKDYGKQQDYIDGVEDSISYGSFYGWDNGEIIFDTHDATKENILIIGESYDNAILKLVAGHFGKTYSIDLRNYETTFGTKFSFSKYVESNNIDKVLLIGSLDYFTLEEFMLED